MARDIRPPIACYFNPHSPCGERLVSMPAKLMVFIFQSTLPLRGATWALTGNYNAQIISIHTPLAGSDRRNETFLTK